MAPRPCPSLFEICDPQLRRRIAEAAARAEHTTIGALIDVMLRDEAPQIRRITACGLPVDDARLALLFDDPDADVRAAVTAHAGAHYPENTAKLVTDSDPKVRAAAFRLIAEDSEQYSGKELEKHVQAAISGDPGSARLAALALVALRGPSVAKGLAHTMTNTKVPLEFRVGAVEAMRRAGATAVPYLVKAVADDERQLRLAAMTALAGFAADDPVWPNPAGDALLAALDGELVAPPAAAEDASDEVEETPDEPQEDAQAVAEEEQEILESLPLVPDTEASGHSTLDAILSGTGEAAPEPAKPVELTEKDLHLLDLSKQRKMSKRKMSLEADVAPHLDVPPLRGQPVGRGGAFRCHGSADRPP